MEDKAGEKVQQFVAAWQRQARLAEAEGEALSPALQVELASGAEQLAQWLDARTLQAAAAVCRRVAAIARTSGGPWALTSELERLGGLMAVDRARGGLPVEPDLVLPVQPNAVGQRHHQAEVGRHADEVPTQRTMSAKRADVPVMAPAPVPLEPSLVASLGDEGVGPQSDRMQQVVAPAPLHPRRPAPERLPSVVVAPLSTPVDAALEREPRGGHADAGPRMGAGAGASPRMRPTLPPRGARDGGLGLSSGAQPILSKKAFGGKGAPQPAASPLPGRVAPGPATERLEARSAEPARAPGARAPARPTAPRAPMRPPEPTERLAAPELPHAPYRRSRAPLWGALLGVLGVTGIFLFREELVTLLSSGPVRQEDWRPTSVSEAVPVPQELQSLRPWVAQSQHRGGRSSPELSALLELQARQLEEAATAPCSPPGESCARDPFALPPDIAEAPVASAAVATRAPALRPQPAVARKQAPLDSLDSLQPSALGVTDAARVLAELRHWVTDVDGRAEVGTLLYDCGAYQPRAEEELVRRGLPRELVAWMVVGSACQSPTPGEGQPGETAAQGLWRLTAPMAQAYRLGLEAGIVDERLSPAKSTAAAALYFADLYRKLGSWELVLAAHHYGALRLMVRIEQSQSHSVQQLAAAGAIPEATLRAVVRTQAMAVLLANLQRFGFDTSARRAPESTAELAAPTGTRLGQIARAAATSVARLRALNPQITSDVVRAAGSGAATIQVPEEVVFRAREVLPVLLRGEESQDLCVHEDFDWGHERFTERMAQQCQARPK